MTLSGSLPISQHSWGSSVVTYAMGQSACSCKRVKHGWCMTRTREELGLSMQYHTNGSLPNHLSDSEVAFFLPERTDVVLDKVIYPQSQPRSTWKVGNCTQPCENEHPARSSCKHMRKLTIKAGESICRKAAGCKNADRDSVFIFFVSLLVSCKMFPLRWGNLVKVIYLLQKSSSIRRIPRWGTMISGSKETMISVYLLAFKI